MNNLRSIENMMTLLLKGNPCLAKLSTRDAYEGYSSVARHVRKPILGKSSDILSKFKIWTVWLFLPKLEKMTVLFQGFRSLT